MTDSNSFGFERLDVYRVARDALAIVVRYREPLRGLPGEVASQLQRASVSCSRIAASSPDQIASKCARTSALLSSRAPIGRR